MVKLQEAKVREKIIPADRFEYKAVLSLDLPCQATKVSDVFSEVIENRRSRRHFSDINIEQLGPLFYLSSRTKESLVNDSGIVIERRNVPSSGAMHSIDCVISRFDSDDWYVYNSHKHAFDKIDVNPSNINIFKNECKNLLKCSNNAYLVWYVCDLDRLGCKYENPETLALRESGALSAVHSLVSESYGLAYCMLGLNGFEKAREFSDQRNLLGVGTAVVGGFSAPV